MSIAPGSQQISGAGDRGVTRPTTRSVGSARPDLSTRAATEDDVEALRAVYRRSSLSNQGDRAALLGSPETLEWIGTGIVDGRTLVASDASGWILGFATVVPVEGGLELEDLFVDPDAMRLGVATRLVDDVVAAATAAREPWIEVTANPHAAAFYASAGFEWVRDDQTQFGPAPRLRRSTAG